MKDVVSLSMFHSDFDTTETTRNSGSDATVGENVIKECLVSALKVGIACSVESPKARMSIADVVVELHSAREIINSR